MFERVVRRVLLLTALSVASACSCLNIYSEHPSGRDGVQASELTTGEVGFEFSGVRIDGDRVALSNGLQNAKASMRGDVSFWMNYESALPITGEVASLTVNGSQVANITYDHASGFRTSGRVDITHFLRPGANQVQFRTLLKGEPDPQIASRTMEASVVGTLPHTCHKTSLPFEKKVEVFEFEWSPS